jgi:HAD superfamily hydrolase (TIGR01549 family)
VRGVYEAVLFDVAGTLVIPEERGAWVRACGVDLALAEELERVGRPGGPYPVGVPVHLSEVYGDRDSSPEAHREAYAGLLGTVVAADVAGRLYERILAPEGWSVYPDAVPTLSALKAKGVVMGAVSNVGFDLRPVLEGHGLLSFLDAVVLSYEVGVTKPDPDVFHMACDALGVEPEQTLMVGDHPEADGGAAEAGLGVLILPMSPAGAPHGLSAVLDMV